MNVVNSLSRTESPSLSFYHLTDRRSAGAQLAISVALVAPAFLLSLATSQANVTLITQKEVNPDGTVFPYNGFPVSAFTTDTGMNSGAPKNTWISYALGFQLTGGDKVNAVIANLSMPLTPNSGFAQRWDVFIDDNDLPVASPTPSSTNVTNGDTHLIVGGFTLFTPTENQFLFGGPPRPSDTATQQYGVGTTLFGGWGFTNAEVAAQGPIVNFAYIVIPRGSESALAYDIQVQTTNGTLYTFQANLPEPTTISLLAFALVGVTLARRRRR
jgi:hypothetical protein